MLKTNTVLTALGLILMSVLGYFGSQMWGDIKDVKTAATSTSVQVQTMSKQVDDHETRIRQTEHDVTILQQLQREDRTVRPPKMTENKPITQ